MKNDVKYASLVLLLAQIFNLFYLLYKWSGAESGWAKLGWFFLGSMIVVWFAGLIVFTFIILYKSNANTRKRDLYALAVIGLMTFFSIMITFGGIS